jgi:hypothetical protein
MATVHRKIKELVQVPPLPVARFMSKRDDTSTGNATGAAHYGSL